MKAKRSQFKQVTILAPGLLGGSIGLALKKRRAAAKVVVWARRIENAQQAVRKKAADRYEAEIKDAVRGSDLVVLCSPVEAMGELARGFRGALSKDAIVTDVGSVKYDVVAQLSATLGKRGTFIGSHPMAGSEKSGIAAARADLFEGTICLVTPAASAPRKKLHRLVEFWQAVGCKVATIPPSEHDEVVARISHLPHLLSAALVNMAARKGPEIFNFIGPGFRDMTRLAGGPPEMWSGICMANHNEIRRAVDEMIEQLEAIRRATANRSVIELRAYLRKAKSLRDEIKFRK